MCDPLVGLALTVGSSLMQYGQANKQAQASMDAGAETRRLLNEQIAEQQRQINQQNQLDKSERTKSGLIERARIQAIAGESGALGFNTDRLVGESYMQQSGDIASMETKRANAIRQTEMDKKAGTVRYSNTVNSAKASAGNLLTSGLQIGGDIYSYKSKTTAKTKAKSGVV